MRKHPLEPFWRITPAEAYDMLRSAEAGDIQILDIQENGDYEACHLPGSRHIPFAWVTERIGELDMERPLLVVCAVGTRSTFAAEVACTLGNERVYNLEGGIEAWRREGLPVERSNGATDRPASSG